MLGPAMVKLSQNNGQPSLLHASFEIIPEVRSKPLCHSIDLGYRLHVNLQLGFIWVPCKL